MSIPDELVDKGLTTGKYAQYVYIFCIVLRIILGYLIFNKMISNLLVYLLSAFVIVAFALKRDKFKKEGIKTWKWYGRTIISYCLLILSTVFNTSSYNIGGIIVILDALAGVTSRILIDTRLT